MRLQPRWINKKRRAKVFKALRKVVPKVPDSVFKLDLVIFAPSGVNGLAFRGRGSTFIYLDPCLELEPQEEVDFTVAHEFAHIVRDMGKSAAELENETPEEEELDEAETDKLAESWGFKTLCTCGDNHHKPGCPIKI